MMNRRIASTAVALVTAFGVTSAAGRGVQETAGVPAPPTRVMAAAMADGADPRRAPVLEEDVVEARTGQQRAPVADRSNTSSREAALYEAGQGEIDRGRWQRAAERFAEVVQLRGSRTDAALYWQAYALDRVGQKAESLAAVAELVKTFPSSRWVADAKALEMQVRQSAGQPARPEAESDEELKLLALQGLQNSDPEQAVPMLEKILQGTQSPRLQERALFVLAQSKSQRARQVLTDVARGSGSGGPRRPDLQYKAVQYLALHGGRESRDVLAEVYQSSTDVDLKRRILRAFGVSGERARVVAAASGESNPELRAEAVQQLGVMRATDELWQLYQKESAVDVKKRIIQALFVGGGVARMSELANNESNVELRRTAIRNLGLMRGAGATDTLLALYNKERDLDTRKAIVQAFFHQNNAEQLVSIARKETDPVMRKELVTVLSRMRSKVATDYLLEVLSK